MTRFFINIKKRFLNTQDLFPAAVTVSLFFHILAVILIRFTPPTENIQTMTTPLSISFILDDSITDGIPDKTAEDQKKDTADSIERAPIEREIKTSEMPPPTVPERTEPDRDPVPKEVSLQPEIPREEVTPVPEIEREKQLSSSALPAIQQNSNPGETPSEPVPEASGRGTEEMETAEGPFLTALESLPGLKGKRSLPAPPYPEPARRFGYEGSVLVEIIINDDGTIRSAEIIRTDAHTILQKICLKTILKKWKFRPPEREVITRKEFIFVLE